MGMRGLGDSATSSLRWSSRPSSRPGCQGLSRRISASPQRKERNLSPPAAEISPRAGSRGLPRAFARPRPWPTEGAGSLVPPPSSGEGRGRHRPRPRGAHGPTATGTTQQNGCRAAGRLRTTGTSPRGLVRRACSASLLRGECQAWSGPSPALRRSGGPAAKAGRPGPSEDGFGAGACAWELGLDGKEGRARNRRGERLQEVWISREEGTGGGFGMEDRSVGRCGRGGWASDRWGPAAERRRVEVRQASAGDGWEAG